MVSRKIFPAICLGSLDQGRQVNVLPMFEFAAKKGQPAGSGVMTNIGYLRHLTGKQRKRSRQ